MNRMNLEQYKGVFIYAQQVDNKIDAIALELLGKANDLAADLGTDVTAVLIGSDVKGLVDELAEYGADKVIVVDDPELKEYRTEPYTHALASVINEYKPDILLVGATAIGRDLGPRVSARVATGLTADCTVLEIGEFKARGDKEPRQGQLLMTRPAFGGNTIATIACPNHRPQMATVRPGVMQKKEPVAGAKAEVIEYNPGFTPNDKYVEILDIVKSVTSASTLKLSGIVTLSLSSLLKFRLSFNPGIPNPTTIFWKTGNSRQKSGRKTKHFPTSGNCINCARVWNLRKPTRNIMTTVRHLPATS